MAFGETWDETAPDGAVITVSQLDDFQRSDRIAVRERLEGDVADANTGIFIAASFATAPKLKELRGKTGVDANVTYGHDGDSNTGVNIPANDEVDLVAGGVAVIHCIASGALVKAVDGAVGAPGIGFLSEATGLYMLGAGLLGIATGGNLGVLINGGAEVTIANSMKLICIASINNRASIRLPHGTAPAAPVNGDMWTTAAGLFVRINGSTIGPLS